MKKGVFLSAIVAMAFSGCASMTYEARCAMPLEKEPSASAVNTTTKLIRENFVYTERVYYNSTEWVLFADKTGRDMNATTGRAHFVYGKGNLLSDATFDVESIEFVDGQFEISQTNPSCYALTDAGETKKGFLATAKQYPFGMKDETEATFKVDYFDFYHPARIQKDGTLSLKHKDSDNNLKISFEDGDYFVNGEKAALQRAEIPFADVSLTVDSSGDTYTIIGMQRRSNDGRYYVLINDDLMLAMSGPNR